MYGARIISRLIIQLFYISVIFAVLWVKGYLWWIFGIALFLYVVHILVNVPLIHRAPVDEDEDEDDDSDERDDE